LDDPVELLDADGNAVRVTGRGLFSADPSRLAAPGGVDSRVASLLPAGDGRSTSGGGTPSWGHSPRKLGAHPPEGQGDPRLDAPPGRRSWSTAMNARKPYCCAIASGAGTSRGSTSR